MTGVDVAREIAPLQHAWDELADRAGATPFVRPGWTSAWWDAFGRGELLIVTLRRDGRLAGVLPAYRHRGVVRATSNWETPEFAPLAEDDDAARRLVDALFRLGGRRLEVGFVDAADDALGTLRAAATRAGRLRNERTLERSPYVELDGGWDAVAERLDGKLLRDLRRRRRRLEEEGSVTVEVHDGRDDLDRLLAEGYAVEPSGWKGGTAILANAAMHAFYSGAARWGADRGYLRLAFLRLDRRALAFELAYEGGGRWYFLKGGYDPAFQRFAPGKLLVLEMVQRACANGLESFEFLGFDEPWKLEWTERVRERVLFQAFARSPVGVAEFAAFAYARPLAARVKPLKRAVLALRR